MSIKNLFDNSRAYVPNTNQKQNYDLVESSKNVESSRAKDTAYVPQVDFSDPSNFCFYGSAELYYKSAISRIYEFYPYDGSRDEKNKFHLNSFDIDKYIYDNLYPKTNGYVRFSNSYISLKGGPNAISSNTTKGLFGNKESQTPVLSNIYSEDIYTFEGLESDFGQGTRESNLKCDFTKGVTVEFWLKSDSLPTAELQTIFNLENSADSSELSIYLSGSTGSPFHFTLNSGSLINDKIQIGSSDVTTSSIESFKHYAISFLSSSSGMRAKLYVNGVLDDTVSITNDIQSFRQDGILATIGKGSDGVYLSASMDEFRFWKVARTSEQIGLNWKFNVDGGTNTDISNTTLGVYYKFNEGITGDTNKDSVVLDYSGRLTNGSFGNYDPNYSRVTSSAMVESGLVESEEKDPIIYSTHPDVIDLYETYSDKGVSHDTENSTNFINYLPSWVSEEHEDLENKNLKYICHIMGSYFDHLFLRIQDINKLKTNIYPQNNNKPVTYAKALPASLGLDTPELFIDATILESISNRNDEKAFEQSLEDTKNLIYSNLYSNLAKIYKSKGTKSSIRNILRALGVPENIVNFTSYMDNDLLELEPKRTQQTINKKFISFNKETNTGATLYISGSGISGSMETGYEDVYGVTYEAQYQFPYFDRRLYAVNRNFITSSLMGIVGTNYSDDTTIIDPSFYVTFERDSIFSQSGKFCLRSTISGLTLTTDNFVDVYDNTNWLISVRIRPENNQSIAGVSGSTTGDYVIEFDGKNVVLDTIADSFSLSAVVSSVDIQTFLQSHKQVFVGARRENITGSLVHKSDYYIGNVASWNKYLSDDELVVHAVDYDNYGLQDYYNELSPIDPNVSGVKNKDLCSFVWQFSDVSQTDSLGSFVSKDLSYGTTDLTSKLAISSYENHECIGINFESESSTFYESKKINTMNQTDIEVSVGDDEVRILTDDDKLYDIKNVIPNYHFFLEKSYYRNVSSEMLNLFSGIVDFNNLIGDYHNTFRMEYKELSKLREVFFRKVNNVTEVEKYIEYYKWFDDAINIIIQQVMPASSQITEGTINTIESHVLERPKYQHKFPLLAFTSSTEGVIFGSEELRYDWKTGHAPVSGLESDNATWWRTRAERTDALSIGNVATDSSRETIRQRINNNNRNSIGQGVTPERTLYNRSTFKYRTVSKGHVFDSKTVKEIKGGVNFEHNKSIHFTQNALHPAGPVNTTDGVYVPTNVLLGFTDDLVGLQDIDDNPNEPWRKIKRNILVQHGREWEDGIGYKNTKSSFSFPFNIISSSVTTGYNAEVIAKATASIEITNLHNDVYGPDMEKPIQGPFTEYAVGGLQSRHVKLNTGNDNYLNRPEAWKIALGKCPNSDGAIGMVGADYPYPEANEVGQNPYPMTGAMKAHLYREELAKRPVNIKNIQHRTGSTILGNYEQNYQVVHTVGGYSNPRTFIDNQPSLPTEAVGADTVKTILDLHRGENSHFTFIDDYNAGYLTGSSSYKNKTVIVNRFSSPGGRETSSPAYKDIRSGEMSVYNGLNNRNLTVLRPYQGVSSSIVSETTGYRNYDHNGQDFGLMNLSARHSTRFFRDSVNQADEEFSNTPRNTPFLAGPASSDEARTERASFHKIHRNNLLQAKEVINTIETNGPSYLLNEDAIYMIAHPTDLSLNTTFASKSQAMTTNLFNAITGSGFTLSGWFCFDTGIGSAEIFNYACDGFGDPLIRFFKDHDGSNHNLQLRIATTGIAGLWKTDGNIFQLIDGNFHHIAVSFDFSSDWSSSNLSFFIDGVSTSFTAISVPTPTDTFSTAVIASYVFRDFTPNVAGNRYFCIGGPSCQIPTPVYRCVVGAMDQISLWTTKLSDPDIIGLYNTGAPNAITNTSVYISNTGSLFSWYKAESSLGDAINPLNTGNITGSNKLQDFSGNDYHMFAITKSGSNNLATIEASHPPFPDALEGELDLITTEVISYECENIYDNLNLQHQIPRSDRQYSWFANSIIHTNSCDPRYSGFMRTDNRELAPYYEIGGEYEPFFSYVSGSEIKDGIYQNTTRLNLQVVDATGSEQNTLGSQTIENALVVPDNGKSLNSLLIRRGDNYGWNWRSTRQKDHPILHREHKSNILTVAKNSTIREFYLPPVSFKGRADIVSITRNQVDYLLQVSNNNEKIYFNQRELNDLQYQKPSDKMTLLDKAIDVGTMSGSEINWLIHTENVFPSTENEMVVSSRQRVGYDNEFWSDEQADRIESSENSFGHVVSQSQWVLDAPYLFLDRTTAIFAPPSNSIRLINQGKSGELQNIYSSYKSFYTSIPRYQVMRPAALYSRKQFLTSPNSVVSRTGFAKTGTLSDTFADQILNYGGEALWEAGEKATITEKSGLNFVTTSYPSKPWFNDYSEFVEDLNLTSRGYAIVPEFRISEHVEDYMKSGIFNKSKMDTFEIVGTDKDSSQETFYKDYSNSDFLKEFALISDKSSLEPNRILLSCKAAIRFNPYKGFYPAQRTLDLVSQFSSSYGAGIVIERNGSIYGLDGAIQDSLVRPLIQPLFAPGILYNSIKSGLAVDYPIVNNANKIDTFNYDNGDPANENYCLTPPERLESISIFKNKYDPNYPYWDYRVPFEAIIEPGRYVDKIKFVDYEPHPSASIGATASLDSSVSDNIYEMMSKNFFGQTAEFFLKDGELTTLKSDLFQDGISFNGTETFAARLKIRKSHSGKRTYENEKGFEGDSSRFTSNGARAYVSASSNPISEISGGYYPLPQDPAHNPDFRETFTMYSRPSAFGPSISGRQTSSVYVNAFDSGTLDSLEGYNWAYTPPYYHGESWVDLIFRPVADKVYTLEDILSEIQTNTWRVDAGEMTGSFTGLQSYKNERLLIQNGIVTGSTGPAAIRVPIYGGSVVNMNAMQLDSSINLFGIERVPLITKDKFGNTIEKRNELAGKKWVIQTKWETPMLNFADVSEDNGNITYPNYLSESVPRGIWHQFGQIPSSPKVGVFLEIGDIPKDWLQYHYDVINHDSIYNNLDAANSGSNAYNEISSLTDLFGFSRIKKIGSTKTKIGELADRKQIYEAIVAVPYIINPSQNYDSVRTNQDVYNKSFINIDRKKFNSLLLENKVSGETTENSASIRGMIEKMKKYVLPPKFDFINFPEIDPFVMYFFEFKYELDKDDLSYIWQNLAPREYQKITHQEATIAHNLMDEELMDKYDILNNQNLRWMVFKVKQKANKDYYDLIYPQAKSPRKTSDLDSDETDKDKEYLKFNWPYDYLSFVELIKLDVSAVYTKDKDTKK